jgi:Tfp pilus assembly protein PilO
MTKSSELVSGLSSVLANAASRRTLSPLQLRLRIAAAVLVLLNAFGLFLYLFPPGGSRQELEQESVRVRSQILSVQSQSSKMRTLASSVQTSSTQAASFSNQYFLPKRAAYVTLFEEIQRMAKESGIQARDASWSEEPIEGTADLTLLTITANYEGSNANLMKFLNEADRSPMLLILDALSAAPQQRNDQINTVIRFQAVVRETPGIQQ